MGRGCGSRHAARNPGPAAVNVRVVREAGGIGDIVRLIPALRGLREKHPEARLWLFAPPLYRPLLRGWYDEFRATPHHGRRRRDAPLDEKRWRYLNVGVRFDVSISLYCPAFRHEHRQRGNVWLDRIDLFCRAADVAPADRTPRVNLHAADVAAATDYIRDNHLKNGRRLIALQPFSTDPARNWPVANFIKLGAALEKSGHRVLILDGCKGRTNGFAQHRVLERPLAFVAALLAQCDLLVAPDSGLGHLAAAVGTPMVGLFASQSPGVMYRHYPLHAYVYPPWDGQGHCRWPCFWNRPRACSRSALVRAGKTCPMLARIRVRDVFAAVQARLNTDTPLHGSPIQLPTMSPEASAALGPVKEIAGLPIPEPDFARDRLALTRGTADAAPILKEAYRVLKPGGVLYLPSPPEHPLSSALSQSGFVTTHDPCHPEIRVCIKMGTWPHPLSDQE